MKGEKLNSLQNISFENANVIVNMTYLFRKLRFIFLPKQSIY